MSRKIAMLVLLPLVALTAGLVIFRFQFPFGGRTCYLGCTMMGLLMYTQDHGGWYPRDCQTYAQCLRTLYPKYLQDARLLAGLSGDRKRAMNILDQNPKLFGTNDT